jgi:hypothetical protein
LNRQPKKPNRSGAISSWSLRFLALAPAEAMNTHPENVFIKKDFSPMTTVLIP